MSGAAVERWTHILNSVKGLGDRPSGERGLGSRRRRAPAGSCGAEQRGGSGLRVSAQTLAQAGNGLRAAGRGTHSRGNPSALRTRRSGWSCGGGKNDALVSHRPSRRGFRREGG